MLLQIVASPIGAGVPLPYDFLLVSLHPHCCSCRGLHGQRMEKEAHSVWADPRSLARALPHQLVCRALFGQWGSAPGELPWASVSVLCPCLSLPG